MSSPSVLVTGGSRGIGRAIALRFAREGFRVVVASRNSTDLDRVVEEIHGAGGQGMAAQMNVRDHGSVEAAVFRAVQFAGGTLDCLVNNAGVFDVVPFSKLDVATWRKHLEVNLDGVFYTTKECLDALVDSGRGHVINVGSVASKQAFAGNVSYCASKFGLRGFSEALRLDLEPQGVRVTTVHPGPTDTTIFDGVPGAWDRTKMNRPEDVAEVVWKAWISPTGSSPELEVPPRA